MRRLVTLVCAMVLLLGGVPAIDAAEAERPPEPTGQIVYQGADRTLRIVTADGSGARTISTRGEAFSPRWSPDGRTILYADELVADPYLSQLVVLDPATGASRVLVAPEARDPNLGLYWSYLQPRWTPDGSAVIYIRSGGSRLTAVMRVAAGGGTPELLFDGTSTTRFDLSPRDGRFILSDDAFAEEATQGSRLLLISPDGYLERILLPRSGAFYFQPTWSPDGSKIIVRRQVARDSKSADLVMIDPVTVEGKVLGTVATNSTFSFSPDGNWLALASGDTKRVSLLPLDTFADGPTLGQGSAPHWAPFPQESRTFPETGFTVSGRFLAYWIANGGLPLYGYPLTNERRETLADGKEYTVQYFERARFEYHPENTDPQYQVLLGQFGRLIRPADPPVAPLAGADYFTETGHNLRGRFADYWRANGGLAQFGYPISEEFVEVLDNGKPYTVQYFERARFEYHPENTDPQYQVLLGQFGRQILEQAGR
jgi:hypothetical protein